MIVLTIVLGLGIGIFLLWFGEALVRDSFEQEENVIIYMKRSSNPRRKNLYSAKRRSYDRVEEHPVETFQSRRAA